MVDEEGAQLGVMPTPQALAMAQERGYDLVEVAPMASPPVVKFLDFGQYKYELTKREKDNKRRQRSVSFKEVRLTPKIGSGDFDTKVHRAIEFLEDGDRIKVTVRFRGRELTHPELGRAMLARFTDRIKEHGTPERAPLLEGKSMHLTVASLHKPKEHEAPVRPPKGHQAEAGAQAPAQAAAEPSEKTEPTARTEPKTASQPAPTPATATEPAPAAPAIETAQASKPEPTRGQEPTKAATPTPESDPGTTEEPSQEEPAKPKAERPRAAASAAPGSAANGTARSQPAPRAPQRTTNDTPAEPAATGE